MADQEAAAAISHDGDGNLTIKRDCIGCDACGKPAPMKSCARCLSYYYCSKECQVRQWEKHKPICKALKAKRDLWEAESEALKPLASVEGPCAICLEDVVTDPVKLDCGHEFCFECLGECKRSAIEDGKREIFCPLCRGESSSNIFEEAGKRGLLYSRRALKAAEGSAERKKYASLAVKDYDVLIGKCPDWVPERAALLYGKARMLTWLGDPDEMIKIGKQFLSAVEFDPPLRQEWQYAFDIKAWMAAAYTAKGQYSFANYVYGSIQDDAVSHTTSEHTEKWVKGLLQCYYESGDDDVTLEIGEELLKVHRQLPGAHKYVAFAQRTKGDIEGSTKTMQMAVLYEQPWNAKNREHNKRILLDLGDPEYKHKRCSKRLLDPASQSSQVSWMSTPRDEEDDVEV